jgi:hypothetical protein
MLLMSSCPGSREAQIVASLKQPNIAHVHGFEEARGRVSAGDGACRVIVNWQ